MPPSDPASQISALAKLIDSVVMRLDDQERVLGELAAEVAELVSRQTQRPWSWLLADDSQDLAVALRDLIEWLGRVYLQYPNSALPSCWLWHPWVVEELLCLRLAHAEAYAPGARSVAKASDWHERLRPGVTGRIRADVGNCDLSDHAADVPAVPRLKHPPLATSATEIAQAWASDEIPTPNDQQLAEAQTTQPSTHT